MSNGELTCCPYTYADSNIRYGLAYVYAYSDT